MEGKGGVWDREDFGKVGRYYRGDRLVGGQDREEGGGIKD